MEPLARRRSPARRRGRDREPSSGQHNRDLQLCAVQLRIVHLCDCALRVVDFLVQDICSAAVDVEGGVHGHAQVLDGAVSTEDFADVRFFDVAG